MIAFENNKKVIEKNGYKYWMKLQNFKQNAKMLNLLKHYGINSIEEWSRKK
ncbi:hypothetical protein ABZY96_000590 [Listeria monocytogenes]|nr:hypothetical protein [Listeria monocytogenes]EIP0689440.1 hypothetical protein [Listeria monocytogenes]EIZ2817164.1 hypothetical protein [Listeria monocytogenes]EJE4617020.1 hypothetical protein [Listeria monocytogenes]EKZ1049413.1 hypothetical protein [Listeria monocytogenes]